MTAKTTTFCHASSTESYHDFVSEFLLLQFAEAREIQNMATIQMLQKLKKKSLKIMYPELIIVRNHKILHRFSKRLHRFSFSWFFFFFF